MSTIFDTNYIILKNMQSKQKSMSGFANYSRNVNLYKANLHSYQRKVDYIKSLYEVGKNIPLSQIHLDYT